MHDKSSGQKTVFVIGAGFSAEFGYPTTQQLFPHLWVRAEEKDTLRKVLSFHFPSWGERMAGLPDIEQFLTSLTANKDLLPKIPATGRFSISDLEKVHKELLFEISRWFHEIHTKRINRPTLETFIRKFLKENNVSIISFNWDYELDRVLFGKNHSPENYGISENSSKSVLLKPHGSLNWYFREYSQHISKTLRIKLCDPIDEFDGIDLFPRWRAPNTKVYRQYVPCIVPPTHMKEFRHPLFLRIWHKCVEVLSVASRVYFFGYSLPPEDWHSRFILRSGFHNQIEGLPSRKNTGRRSPTGPARVIVVNPDRNAFLRIENAVGRECKWIPRTIGDWIL